jgi:hypothetical protein
LTTATAICGLAVAGIWTATKLEVDTTKPYATLASEVPALYKNDFFMLILFLLCPLFARDAAPPEKPASAAPANCQAMTDYLVSGGDPTRVRNQN